MSSNITYKPGTYVKLNRNFKDWGLSAGQMCMVVTGDYRVGYICRLLYRNKLLRFDANVPVGISDYNAETDFTISAMYLDPIETRKISIKIKLPK